MNELQTTLDEIKLDKDTNLKPENLRQGITCLGVVGNMQEGIDTSDATATTENILASKTAYANGQKLTGTMVNNGLINITPSSIEQQIPAGYTSGGTVATDMDLLPENIKKGINIFGVEGSLESSTNIEKIKQYTSYEDALLSAPDNFIEDMTGLVYDKTWYNFSTTPRNNNYKVRLAILEFNDSNPKPTNGTYFGNFECFVGEDYISLNEYQSGQMHQFQWNQDVNNPNRYIPASSQIYNYDPIFNDIQKFIEYAYRDVKVILTTTERSIRNFFSTVKSTTIEQRPVKEIIDGIYKGDTFSFWFNWAHESCHDIFSSNIDLDFNKYHDIEGIFLNEEKQLFAIILEYPKNLQTISKINIKFVIENDIIQPKIKIISNGATDITNPEVKFNLYKVNAKNEIEFVRTLNELKIITDGKGSIIEIPEIKYANSTSWFFNEDLVNDWKFEYIWQIDTNNLSEIKLNDIAANKIVLTKYGPKQGIMGSTQDLEQFNGVNNDIFTNYYKSLDNKIISMKDIRNIYPKISVLPFNRQNKCILDLNTPDAVDLNDYYGVFSNMEYVPDLEFPITTSISDSLFKEMDPMGPPTSNCKNIGNLNFPVLTSGLEYSFSNMNNLIDIGVITAPKITSMSDMFSNCPNLSDKSLNNILQTCINAESVVENKTLRSIGLESEQATKCQSLSNWQAFTTAGWTSGY